MGMDIYFSAKNADGQPLGEPLNIRCREVYHIFNDWCESQGRETPESAEKLELTAEQWAKLADKVHTALYQLSVDLGATGAEAIEDANRAIARISPPGAHIVTYWFTV